MVRKKKSESTGFDWKTPISLLALLVSLGSYVNSCRATKLAQDVSDANREPKISLTNLRLKSRQPPIVTYDLKNYGTATARSLAIVPIVITDQMHTADNRTAMATMILNPGEQVSRTFEFLPDEIPGYGSSPDPLSASIGLSLHFDIMYVDANNQGTHKCIAFKFVTATQEFDRDSDCLPMYSNKAAPY